MIEELASWGAWGAVFSCEVTYPQAEGMFKDEFPISFSPFGGICEDMYPFAGEKSFNQLEGLEVKAEGC